MHKVKINNNNKNMRCPSFHHPMERHAGLAVQRRGTRVVAHLSRGDLGSMCVSRRTEPLAAAKEFLVP